MAYKSDSLWDDKDFLIEAGDLPDQGMISGTDLGAGIIYSAPPIHLTHRWTRSVQIQSSATTRDCVWNTGAQSEIENPTARSSPYIRVALKPSPGLMQAIPQPILGEAYACLLYGNYAESFRHGVAEDLMAIRVFAEQIRHGRGVDPEAKELAILAKDDLDLKLFGLAQGFTSPIRFSSSFPLRLGNFSSPSPNNGIINVKVETWDKNNTKASLSGCTVWYVSVINSKKPGHYKSFSKFSTPTTEAMAIGNFEMWTEKGSQLGVRRKVSITGSQRPHIVDLPGP